MDRERITEALSKYRVAEAATDAEAETAAPAEAAPATTGEQKPAEAAAATEAAPAEASKPAVDVDAYSRMEARNRELVSELEKLRSAPRGGGSDLATQAAKMYLQDPQRALRMLVAAGLEIEDLESKDIDGELEGLLLEAAGKDLGVPLEPTKKLEHDQRRLRHQLRLQKTEASRPKAADDDGTAQRLEIIERVASPIVEKYPHARDLAEHIDGKPLREIVNQVILVGLATGELDGNASNEALVSRALDVIESRYKRIGDRIVASRKPAESPTSGASDKPGARTVTTSNASVAPTKAPEPPKQEQEKEPASEEERRAAILARHFKR